LFIVRYCAAYEPARVGIADGIGGTVRPVEGVGSLAELLGLPLDRIRSVVESAATADPVGGAVRLLPPIDGRTEVWASGVTYERSRDARVEESSEKTVYQRIYEAARPELFFKSVAWRVVTDGEPIGLRADSGLDVPEPELAAVANSAGELVGYLVCDDVSSRSIEGENPLYLPQAKIYAGACALSLGIRPAWEVDADDLAITLTVTRDGASAYTEQTSTARMHRSIPDLLGWLFVADSHPAGAVLSTGTGIIPGLEFTLADGDVVRIDIDGVGSLSNPVTIGAAAFAGLTDDTADTVDRRVALTS